MNQDKNKKKGKAKNAILSVIAVLIMIGVCVWYYFYAEGQKYFQTDNAKVSAEMYSITPDATGKLERYSVKSGSYVKEDEIIGRIKYGGLIRAPIDGVIVTSNVKANQIVTPSTTVAVIADVNNVYIQANVEETDILKIKAGQKVIVQLDAYPGQKFSAHVSEVDMTTQSALTGAATTFSTSGTYTKTTQLIPVKIALNEDIKLEKIIGTNAKVKISIKD